MSNMCPACGYTHLENPAYFNSAGAWPSLEICPSCGFQFGYTDNAQQITFKQWREQWVARGMPWRSKGINPPSNWNPSQQLLNVSEKT